MTRPIIQFHDVATDESVVREMNDEEFAIYQKTQKEVLEIQKEIAAKEATRQSALSKLIDLGLTEEEAKAFLG